MSANSANLRKIGANIRKYRLSKQIKQENLGRMVDLDKSEISRIENGQRDPKINKLIEIASAIGVTAAALFEE